MIQYPPERFYRRDHWPPGFSNPVASELLHSSIARPTGRIRSLLTHRPTGDPNYFYIL